MIPQSQGYLEMPPDDALLDADEVGRLLRIDRTTVHRWAEARGYVSKRLKPFEQPLGSEAVQWIVRCRRGAWLWDASPVSPTNPLIGQHFIGFHLPCPSKSRRYWVKRIRALPGVSGVRWDDPEEPGQPQGTGGIDGYIAWEAWTDAHEKLLRPFRRRRLSPEARAKAVRNLRPFGSSPAQDVAQEAAEESVEEEQPQAPEDPQSSEQPPESRF